MSFEDLWKNACVNAFYQESCCKLERSDLMMTKCRRADWTDAMLNVCTQSSALMLLTSLKDHALYWMACLGQFIMDLLAWQVMIKSYSTFWITQMLKLFFHLWQTDAMLNTWNINPDNNVVIAAGICHSSLFLREEGTLENSYKGFKLYQLRTL
jgi:hypothetical protein